MEQFFVSKALKYYKRPEVQEAIARHAKDREVSPRYGDGFGKRPDVMENPRDVLEFATRKTTSFHCSEERWDNPMRIETGMSRKDADELRIGWDLVLDIDAKDWEIARLTAWLFIQALKQHDVNAVSCKFSGNKGWHVGVPFEAFTTGIVTRQGEDVHMSKLFPEMPRAIATYLVDYIGDPTNGLVRIDEDEVTFGGKVKASLSKIAEKAGRTKAEILERYCSSCMKAVKESKEEHILFCTRCGFRKGKRYTPEEKNSLDDNERECPKCKHIMDFQMVSRPSGCTHDPSGYYQRFNITAVVEFDTVMLASRHLFRMPYSLHEKSGLVSVPIDPDDVLTFKKEMASPDKVEFTRSFLDVENVVHGEASALVQKAWERQDHQPKRTRPEEYDVPDEAIEEKHFPPCMVKILEGMEDGKKRALFALVNFLQTAGWPPEMITDRIEKWNDNNPEQLREVTIKGHLRQHLGKKLKILPPNCLQFYQELGVCFPDDLCRTIKNPTQYARKKAKVKR